MLSDKQEFELIKKAQNGDMFARGKLIEYNSRLVKHVAMKFYKTEENNDDLISVGMIALIKTIDSYNLDKGTRLATYAARCIENEILMYIRAEKKIEESEISLENELGYYDNGEPIYLTNIINDLRTEEIIEKYNNEFEYIQYFLGLLSDKERMVVLLRFGFNGHPPMTIKDIALLMNISTSYVFKLLKVSKMKITEQLKKDRSI